MVQDPCPQGDCSRSFRLTFSSGLTRLVRPGGITSKHPQHSCIPHLNPRYPHHPPLPAPFPSDPVPSFHSSDEPSESLLFLTRFSPASASFTSPYYPQRFRHLHPFHGSHSFDPSKLSEYPTLGLPLYSCPLTDISISFRSLQFFSPPPFSSNNYPTLSDPSTILTVLGQGPASPSGPVASVSGPCTCLKDPYLVPSHQRPGSAPSSEASHTRPGLRPPQRPPTLLGSAQPSPAAAPPRPAVC